MIYENIGHLQVTKAKSGYDSNVRNVKLRYKEQDQGIAYQVHSQVDSKIQRSVHRTVVILPIKEQS